MLFLSTLDYIDIMAEKKVMPPVFSPEEDDDYVAWRNDVEVWKLLTETKPEKLGLSVYLNLKGQARDVVCNLKPADIAVTDGYQIVIDELDKVYLKDNTTQAFCAFKDFYEYKRSAGQNFAEFIVEYDQRYRKVEKYEMTLPQGVQAFFLLKAANLTVESEKLARATAKLEYKDMREKLARIFGDPGVLDEKDKAPDVKEEALFGQSGFDKRKWRGGMNRGRGDGGWRQGSGRGTGSQSGNNGGNNAGGSRGRGRGGSNSGRGRSKCFRCDSEDHFVRDCPVPPVQQPPIEEAEVIEEAIISVHITLFLSKYRLHIEALGKGLLDSGCSKTVAGIIWYMEYLNTLTKEEREKVKEVESRAVFRFGDGVETKSMKRVTVPVYIGRQKFIIDIEVVENEIPLLISKGAMKQMGMKLDFENDVAIIRGEKLKLLCTSSGHYCCLPLNFTWLEDNSIDFHSASPLS